MREKLQTLPMTELREIAKANGIKSVTTMRKSALIDKILEVTEHSAQNSGSDTSDTAENTVPGQMQASAPEQTYSQNQQQTQGQTYSQNQQQTQGQTYSQNQQQSYTHRQPYNQQQSYGQRQSQPYSRTYTSRNNSDQSEGRTYTPRNNSDQSEGRTCTPRNNSDQSEGRTYTPRNNYQSEGRTRTEGQNGEQRTMPYMDESLDSGIVANGILEVMPDGFGFIRCDNYMPGDADVYVSPMQIKRLGLRTGDIIKGKVRIRTQNEKFAALLCVDSVNGYSIGEVLGRKKFEDLTPIFPNERLVMETSRHNMAMRIVDILSPIGKGQRGMIVSPPKAGKTTLLKEFAKSITQNNPDIKMIILLIDERPEEVTDIKESIEGENVEVIYSTFDELPEHHKRVSEMVIERAKRLVEHGEDVVILLDSITRLSRAYNMTIQPSGRTLSGGLDPAALHMPKRFFGAARNMREGGSLTILATALVDTGSKMDDVVFEEFKGTGNMEMVLDRKLSEKRVFPAIDLLKSGTRRDDLLLNPKEQKAVDIIRKMTHSMKPEDAVDTLLNLFSKTANNDEFCERTIQEFEHKVR